MLLGNFMIFPHRRSLQTKTNKNYKGKGKVFQNFMERHYNPWAQRNMQLSGVRKGDVGKRVKCFEKYLEAINNLNKNPPNWITPQSKFRQSALEEFACYLIKVIDLINILGLKFTNKKCLLVKYQR